MTPIQSPSLMARLVGRLKLLRCAKVGAGVRVLGKVYIHGGGRVVIGDRVTLDGRTCPIELHAEPKGEIILGNDVYVGSGTSIEAQERVQVGNGCRILSYTKILDNNFHPLRGNRHAVPESKPVVLEEGVEVGSKAIVLPGTHVQAAAVIMAGAVVSRPVPRGATVGGFPARPMKRGQT